MFKTKITIIALAMCATLRVINAAACTNQDGSAVSAFADPALAYEECDCGIGTDKFTCYSGSFCNAAQKSCQCVADDKVYCHSDVKIICSVEAGKTNTDCAGATTDFACFQASEDANPCESAKGAATISSRKYSCKPVSGAYMGTVCGPNKGDVQRGYFSDDKCTTKTASMFTIFSSNAKTVYGSDGNAVSSGSSGDITVTSTCDPNGWQWSEPAAATAAAKCGDITDALAWCKAADSSKFTNGLISDSNGIPVVKDCKADPCTKVDDGATCCEDMSISGDTTAGKCGGNTATATDLAEEADDETFQFACGDGKTLKPSASQITGKTIDACCDDASSGGGNQQPSFPACEADKVGVWSKALGAEGATYMELCMCTGASATAVGTCSAGSTCSSKATTADTVCSCTPSATTICYEMKSTAEGNEGKLMQMMSYRPGCFDIGTVMSLKIGCAATGTDAQQQMFKGKGCAAGSEYTDAEAKAAMGEDSTSITPLSSAWVVNKNEATTFTRYSSTCYGGVQHADSTAAAAAETAAAAPAPGPSGELSLGSSTSVGFAAVVLVAAAALANIL